ncbi:hypothetical protein JL722_2923 [Aureococcus anophagefferens]|nr:hypothetical protein JL722_2923 [Aureococcus anophagefferens]
MRRGLAMLAFCASTLAFAPVHRQPSMSTLGASMNVNDIVDKAYEGKSFAELAASPALDEAHEGKTIKEILALPPSALQGIAEHSDADLAKFKVRTVADLGAWKFAIAASAIATLAEVESGDLGEHR